jgi:hypothetical protein
MGAALICFIVKGPDQISSEAKKAAIQQAECFRSLLDRWNNENAETFDQFLAKTNNTRGDLVCNTEGVSNDTEFWEVSHLRNINPTAWVDNFIAFWNEKMREPFVRDISWRTDPDDKTQIIVVAGGESWGDEPDGDGYQTLKAAFRVGITKMMGLR